MIKKLILLSSFYLFTSCFIHKGSYVDGNCRPKSPNFKLSDQHFEKTDKIKLNLVYIADNATSATGYVFLGDGRMICVNSKNGFELKSEDVLAKNWHNANAIGYWRTENNKITIEYFVCGNSGVYIKKLGEIKDDTLIFERNCGTPNPFKSIKCPEKYKISNFILE